jgi:hypothetical protein
MGVIDQVGIAVDPARIGELVWVWNGAFGRQCGTASEYIALPEGRPFRSRRTPGAAAASYAGRLLMMDRAQPEPIQRTHSNSRGTADSKQPTSFPHYFPTITEKRRQEAP